MSTKTYELEAISQKSHNGKAKVTVHDNGTKTLVSYRTEVASLDPETRTFTLNDYYSATTARHIRDFLNSEGVRQWNMNKSQMEEIAGTAQRY